METRISIFPLGFQSLWPEISLKPTEELDCMYGGVIKSATELD